MIDQINLDSKDCEYFPTFKGFGRAWNFKFPQRIYLKSQWTGETLEFNPVTVDDPKFDQDGWDGEQMIYRAVSSDPKKRELTLSLYHNQ
jgi:hypothetical protein